MPRTSKNKFEIINDEIHISKEGWPLIGLTTYREDYYEELTSKTWTLTKANSETDDKGYLSNKTLGLLHRYIVAKWYGQDVLDTMTQKGFVVDHLNNNHTDCRILRSATVDGLRFPDVGVAPACVRTSDNLHGICHFCIFTHYHIPP